MKPSTRNLAALPATESLRKLCQSVAMLDAIICPDWEGRIFSFNSHWAPDEMMASIRNGCGDEVFILFTQAGVIIKGFWHESPLSPYGNKGQVWDGILTEVPHEFAGFLTEEAFSIQDTTFCIWRLAGQNQWEAGKVSLPEELSKYEDPDGSGSLLAQLGGDPLSYQELAGEYFETEIELDIIKRIYNHEILTEELIRELNPEISMDDLEDDLEEIGYPNQISY